MLNKMETKNSLKTLKFRNRRLVLSFMRNSSAVSVNEISRATGLSKMTVHKIIDHYLEEGMISYAGKGVSTEEGGKKPNLFIFNAHCRYIYAIRMGDKFMSTSIVNLKGEMIVGRRRVTLDNVSFDDAIRMMIDSYRQQILEGELPEEDCLAAVVGCNGIVDVDNGICLAAYQYPEWGKNIPIRDRLRSHLPEHVSIHVDSWWRHLAHGELHREGGESGHRFFMIGNSGDYISGGMVDDGHVYQGETGFAGEIGHLIVAPGSSETCVCGGKGCLEAMAAPGRIIKHALDRKSQYSNSLIFAKHLAGGLGDIGEAADNGDELAKTLLNEVSDHFAVAVNNIVHICDPGKIVLFGDFSKMGKYFLETLRSKANGFCLHGIDKRTRIEYSAFGDDYGVVGAANRVTDSLFAGGGR